MSDMDQRNASILTPELWAEVFTHLELRPDNVDIRDKTEHLKQRLNQKEVHQMKLVCKHFKQIHASQPSLVQRLYISQAFAATSLPSLLIWLHQSKSLLQLFQSTLEGLLVDVVLAGLVSPESNIKLLHMSDVSARSIPMIATFTCLGKCALGHDRLDRLDLSPLGGLPKLSHLALKGAFRELYHLTGLTRLVCSQCEIYGVKFPTTLQYLDIEASTLLRVQEQGFAACIALTQLVLLDALTEGFMDTNDDLVWATDMSDVVGMSSSFGFPTQLERLQLSTGTSHPASLEGISNLISLQELGIFLTETYHSSDSDSNSDIDRDSDVLQHVSLLTQLTYLTISTRGHFCGEAPMVNVDIEWHRLHALQCDVTAWQWICWHLKIAPFEFCSVY